MREYRADEAACAVYEGESPGGRMAVVMALGLFFAVGLALMAGYPVAFTLAGVALIFAGIGALTGHFDPVFLEAFPNRVFGIMTNETLIAVPVFVFMGVMLERSKLADQLLQSLAQIMRGMPGGLGLAVVVVGALMAASTGIVGATVVTMGLISLPTMLRKGYEPAVATGTICAAGTLGQIIPPSIVLVMLADVLSNAYQQAQLQLGSYSPKTVSVGELFAGALLPGLVLVGFYLPSEGTLTVDGYDLTVIDKEYYRAQIGYVMQSNLLFSGSIAENIASGEENPDRNRIIEVAKLADAHGFIANMPLGYEQVVGERGVGLSGGQLQRLCIARALYHNPRLLIFDEATSALDTHSESNILSNMQQILRGRTAVVIAHRLSTIMSADKILVLYNGSIVEEGKHSELVDRKGMYFQLVKKQIASG